MSDSSNDIIDYSASDNMSRLGEDSDNEEEKRAADIRNLRPRSNYYPNLYLETGCGNGERTSIVNSNVTPVAFGCFHSIVMVSPTVEDELASDLKNLLNNEEFSDITFIIENK